MVKEEFKAWHEFFGVIVEHEDRMRVCQEDDDNMKLGHKDNESWSSIVSIIITY